LKLYLSYVRCGYPPAYQKRVDNLLPYVFNYFIIALELLFISLRDFYLFFSETLNMEKWRGRKTILLHNCHFLTINPSNYEQPRA
jgi:hypothetical protein